MSGYYVLAENCFRSPMDSKVTKSTDVFVCGSRGEAWKVRKNVSNHIDYSSARVTDSFPYTSISPEAGTYLFPQGASNLVERVRVLDRGNFPAFYSSKGNLFE